MWNGGEKGKRKQIELLHTLSPYHVLIYTCSYPPYVRLQMGRRETQKKTFFVFPLFPRHRCMLMEEGTRMEGRD